MTSKRWFEKGVFVRRRDLTVNYLYCLVTATGSIALHHLSGPPPLREGENNLRVAVVLYLVCYVLL